MQNILKFLKDNSVLAFIQVNASGNILDFSNNLKKFLHKDQDLLHSVRPFIWMEDLHKFELFFNNILRTGYDVGTFEVNFSQNRYEKINISGCTSDGKKDEFIIYFGRKNVDVINTTHSIESQMNFYKEFSKVFDGLYIEFNENFKIEHVLGESNEFFGIKTEELLLENFDFTKFIFNEDLENFQVIHNIHNISKNVQDYSFRLRKNDGTVYWVKEYLLLVEKRGKKSILALLYNIDSVKVEYDNMLQSKKQLLDLANHLELTREQERKNMAREIHDEIGHALTSLKLDINLLLKKKYLREEKLESRLGDMQKHIEETIRMLQRISAQLRPSILDHFGLIAALEWQAKEFQRQTSIRCKYEMPDEDVEINEHKTVAVFRIFQEILTNITRHSNASRVDVFLTIENNILELKVSDNGIGIRKEDLESSKSLGLIGMKERANLVEGKLTINSILNIGTTVHLTVAIN